MFFKQIVVEGAGPQLRTFFLCSKPKKRKSLDSGQNVKHVNVQFLELDSHYLASEGAQRLHSVNGNVLSCKCEIATDLLMSGVDTQNERQGREYIENVTSSSSVPQSSLDPNWTKLQSGIDSTPPAKMRKLNGERSDPKNSRMLLQKRQFYHSHRVQPMELEQVLSDLDSEDEVDDETADLEDWRVNLIMLSEDFWVISTWVPLMLDDFVDVTKDEKHLMHFWNSFVRKQSVLADAHVPWACEAFSKLHGQELVSAPALFWCRRLFMIKLWNHGLLYACTMNSCNVILNGYKN